jgi:hypothetical protein
MPTSLERTGDRSRADPARPIRQIERTTGSMFSGRSTEPAQVGPKEVRIPQEVNDFRQRSLRITQLAMRKLASRLVNEFDERRAFIAAPTLKSMIAEAEVRSDLRAARTAILQIEPHPAATLFGHQRYGGRIAHDAEISNKAAQPMSKSGLDIMA